MIENGGGGGGAIIPLFRGFMKATTMVGGQKNFESIHLSLLSLKIFLKMLFLYKVCFILLFTTNIVVFFIKFLALSMLFKTLFNFASIILLAFSKNLFSFFSSSTCPINSLRNYPCLDFLLGLETGIVTSCW